MLLCQENRIPVQLADKFIGPGDHRIFQREGPFLNTGQGIFVDVFIVRTGQDRPPVTGMDPRGNFQFIFGDGQEGIIRSILHGSNTVHPVHVGILCDSPGPYHMGDINRHRWFPQGCPENGLQGVVPRFYSLENRPRSGLVAADAIGGAVIAVPIVISLLAHHIFADHLHKCLGIETSALRQIRQQVLGPQIAVDPGIIPDKIIEVGAVDKARMIGGSRHHDLAFVIGNFTGIGIIFAIFYIFEAIREITGKTFI